MGCHFLLIPTVKCTQDDKNADTRKPRRLTYRQHRRPNTQICTRDTPRYSEACIHMCTHGRGSQTHTVLHTAPFTVTHMHTVCMYTQTQVRTCIHAALNGRHPVLRGLPTRRPRAAALTHSDPDCSQPQARSPSSLHQMFHSPSGGKGN